MLTLKTVSTESSALSRYYLFTTMKLKLTAYKTNHEIWAFDHEHQNTEYEALCNGTELVLDWYFEVLNYKKPISGDRLEIQLATENELIYPISELNLIQTCDTGSVYVDKFSGKEVWLCPWLQGYFGHVPEHIQVLCEKYVDYTEIDELIDRMIDEGSL